LVSGIVQGVSFRSSVRNRATLLDLKGYVKNLDSNDVEAIIEGEDKNVDDLIEFCKKGPLLARVENIKINEEEYKNEFKEFEIRH